MFEYVASGLAHTRMAKKILRDLHDVSDTNETSLIINSLIKSVNQDHHKLSFLFNAYTELELGKVFNKILYKDTLYNIYSDSGGLQMITLGHKSTPELKMDVYKTQSKYSTVGMAFDEIPVEIIGGRSERGDTSGRFFNSKILEQKARETGKNLRNQIEYFKSNPDNKCKVMMIIQGNDYDSYQKWTDLVLEEVGHNNWKHIKGISSGAAALGQGTFEDFKRLFYMTHLSLPKEFEVSHYHLLGVGSLSRLLPIFELKRNKTISDNTLISYDSTTHTSGISMGNYFMDNRLMPFPPYIDKNFYSVIENINKNLSLLGFTKLLDVDQLYCRISKPSEWDKKYKDSVSEYNTIFGYLISSIYNFMNSVDKLNSDISFYDNFIEEKGLYMPIKVFGQCNDIKDFNEWTKCFGKVLNSKSVNNIENFVSLEQFF